MYTVIFPSEQVYYKSFFEISIISLCKKLNVYVHLYY